jgi:DNA-binding NtrC family response regulator
VIDDDPDGREFITTALCEIETGVVCETARNGREALNHIVANSFYPDLIILDLNMPLMNGKEFLKAIKEKGLLDNVPIIVFSTTRDVATIGEVKRLGAVGFHTKPDNYEKLVLALRDVLKYRY